MAERSARKGVSPAMFSSFAVSASVGGFLSYIDGGSASMIFQALMGGILAVGVAASGRLHWVKSKLSSLKKRSGPSPR